MEEALPELGRLSESGRDEFLYRHARLQRTVRLAPGAGAVLAELVEKKALLGLASNCQPYTLRELDAALEAAHLTRAMFKPDLSFFSFAFGFSKPNAHVFRVLRARLQACNVRPGETLIVGDRPDNDIAPAQAHGFPTWLLSEDPSPDRQSGGDWSVLRRYLAHFV